MTLREDGRLDILPSIIPVTRDNVVPFIHAIAEKLRSLPADEGPEYLALPRDWQAGIRALDIDNQKGEE